MNYSDLPPALDATQTAQVLGMSERTVRAHIRDGSIPHVRLGRLVRVPRHALIGLLETTESPAGEAGPSNPEPPTNQTGGSL